jgi:hypothetical protein
MNRSAPTLMDLSAIRPNWLPQSVIDLAVRLGARADGTTVKLTQHGTIRSGPAALRTRYHAR